MSVTIKDIAREANVAVSTVSKVLNKRDASIGEATRIRVRETAERLGYQPNMVARGLRAKSTRTLGFVLPDITNPYFPAIARGIEDTAHEVGYTVIFCDTDDDVNRESSSIRTLTAKMIDGIILTHALDTRLSNLEESQVPTVVVDRFLHDITSGVGLVYTDMKIATRMATDYLFTKGCSNISLIAARRNLAPNRFEGYADSLAKHGILLREELVFEGDYDAETGGRGIEILCNRASFDGVVCGNDLIAMGAIRALRCHGKAVPQDVRVIGLDDIYLARYFEPSLTTVRQPAYEIGQAAAQMLITSLSGGVQLSIKELPFKLMIRESA